ncbi:MAG: CbrC family protein [Planctomycetes bacterium]|jgi:uncharacterized protein CbrC (UPF0167 family)|nr:CbrC family protein [Planctomycetota bacterium]
MSSALPKFRFHPEPLLSGAIETSDAECGVCGQTRGFVYAGPCYVEDDFDAQLCPWCIADGSAHRKFGVTFHELELPPEIEVEVLDEIEERTPGITSFNPVEWPVCCKAPMAYLEPAGKKEIQKRHAKLPPALVAQMAEEFELPPAEAQQLFDSLQRDESPCAHIFRCAACEAVRAQIDFD